MKHLFIVNPTAGGHDATTAVSARVKAAFAQRGGEFEIYVTRGPMDATAKIVEEAASGEHIHVYACGGDGTFNECVCGAAQLPNVAVCPFPTGTGNDFCRMFGPEADMYRDLDALLDGDEHPIDLIDCNGRWCANICSVGIDARIGTSVHKYSHLPLIGGAAGYVVSAVANVFQGINRNMYIKCGDFYAEGKHALVCVCNGRYYGGGFNPSLTARPDDGELDFFIVGPVNLITFAALIGKYASGKADELPQHVTHLKGTSIEIGFDEDNVINVDGEALYSSKVNIRIVPGAARLIVPKGMKFFEEAAQQPAKEAAAALQQA